MSNMQTIGNGGQTDTPPPMPNPMVPPAPVTDPVSSDPGMPEHPIQPTDPTEPTHPTA